MSLAVQELLESAIKALQAGDSTYAERSFRQLCTVRSGDAADAEVLSFLGIALQQQGKIEEARVAFHQSIEADPDWADPHYNLGELLKNLGNFDGAIDQYRRCVAIDPAHPLAWRRLLESLHLQRDMIGAAEAGRTALQLAPSDAHLTLFVARVLLGEAHELPEAWPMLRRAAAALPDSLEAHVLLYKAATRMNNAQVAVSAADRAAEIAPDDTKVLLERITLLRQARRHDRAIEAAVDYVKRYAEDPAGHHALALALIATNEFGAAAMAAARTVELRPDEASNQMLLGDVYVRMGRSRDAVEPLQRAVELDPNLSGARILLSVAHESLGRRPEAVAEATKLVELDPDHVEGVSWLGTLFVRQGKHVQGQVQFDLALEKMPGHVPSLCGAGMLAASRAQPERAWELFRQAIDVAPTDPYPCAAGLLGINGHPNLPADALLDLHLEWARRLHAQLPPPDSFWPNDPQPERRLRVGYVSPDLRAHSVAYFVEPLLAAHDRSRFEIIVFDSAPVMDNITLHIRNSVDDWVRVVGVGDDRVSELIREHRIDILVDLAAHTADSRVTVFARHPAPVQVTYLGYPNTTGLAEIGYRLTDAVADPPGRSDQYHVEKLVRLPGGFLCFNPPAPHPPINPLPAGVDGPITFASFNAVHKVNGAVIETWSRAMKIVPGSTLLMKGSGLSDTETRSMLLDRFAENGIDADRVCFCERTVSYRDHLQTYDRCDIALDTFPYNGTTTTCEALWMGIPVIALAGDRHASRVSLSILTRLGLDDLAGSTTDDFVRKAAGLAADRTRLTDLRSTLRERMRASRLMDAKSHAAEVENAYRTMWRSWCANQHTSTPAMELP